MSDIIDGDVGYGVPVELSVSGLTGIMQSLTLSGDSQDDVVYDEDGAPVGGATFANPQTFSGELLIEDDGLQAVTVPQEVTIDSVKYIMTTCEQTWASRTAARFRCSGRAVINPA
jgi:hypothetical protein